MDLNNNSRTIYLALTGCHPQPNCLIRYFIKCYFIICYFMTCYFKNFRPGLGLRFCFANTLPACLAVHVEGPEQHVGVTKEALQILLPGPHHPLKLGLRWSYVCLCVQRSFSSSSGDSSTQQSLRTTGMEAIGSGKREVVVKRHCLCLFLISEGSEW